MALRFRDACRQLAVALLLLPLLVVVGCTSNRSPLVTPSPTPSDEGSRPIEFEAADGTPLRGRLFAADTQHLVILLHQFSEDQSSWFPTARRLQAGGLSALTFDFRGFGASIAARDTDLLVNDANGALHYAATHGYERVLLIGASMGGTAAVITAISPEGQRAVDGVVAISAPVEFGRLLTVPAAKLLDVPLLLIAATEDASAEASLDEIAVAAELPRDRIITWPGAAHGTDLIEGESAAGVRTRLDLFIHGVWPERGHLP